MLHLSKKPIKVLASLLFLLTVSLCGRENHNSMSPMKVEQGEKPEYLYKILSFRNWQATQNRRFVALSAEDDAFIHLSEENQIEKVISKYWSDSKQIVILKVDTNKLEGRLIYESNPGRTTKYFHLYDGIIPFNSIVESKI